MTGISDAAPHHPRWTERRTAINLSDPTTDQIVQPYLTEEQRQELILRYAKAHRALLALTEKESDVVRRFYGFHTGKPMDLRECADDLNMSYNAVKKAHHRALIRMQKVLKVKARGSSPQVWWTGSEGYGW